MKVDIKRASVPEIESKYQSKVLQLPNSEPSCESEKIQLHLLVVRILQIQRSSDDVLQRKVFSPRSIHSNRQTARVPEANERSNERRTASSELSANSRVCWKTDSQKLQFQMQRRLWPRRPEKVIHVLHVFEESARCSDRSHVRQTLTDIRQYLIAEGAAEMSDFCVVSQCRQSSDNQLSESFEK